jgi:hypothetical protein
MIQRVSKATVIITAKTIISTHMAIFEALKLKLSIRIFFSVRMSVLGTQHIEVGGVLEPRLYLLEL